MGWISEEGVLSNECGAVGEVNKGYVGTDDVAQLCDTKIHSVEVVRRYDEDEADSFPAADVGETAEIANLDGVDSVGSDDVSRTRETGCDTPIQRLISTPNNLTRINEVAENLYEGGIVTIQIRLQFYILIPVDVSDDRIHSGNPCIRAHPLYSPVEVGNVGEVELGEVVVDDKRRAMASGKHVVELHGGQHDAICVGSGIIDRHPEGIGKNLRDVVVVGT